MKKLLFGKKMLNTNFILKGPPERCNIPRGLPTGEYFINCLKKRNPDDIFCVDGTTGKEVTCGETLEQTFKTVLILKEIGVKCGDVVSIISENCVKYCTLLYAIFYVGAAANPINPFYTTEELKKVLHLTSPKVIFSSKSSYKQLNTMKNEDFCINRIILLEEVPKDEKDVAETVLLDDLLKITSVNKEIKPPKIDSMKETVLILLSSGTTGLPKCLMLTHENSVPIFEAFGDPDFIVVKPGDSTIAMLPFFHILGYSATCLAVLYSLKLIVLPTFQADVYLRCIEDYNITLLYAVPSVVSFLVGHPLVKRHNLNSLKYVMCGGGYLPTETENKFSELFPNASIVQMYGATETSGIATVRPPTVSVKPQSVGKLIPTVESMVWDTTRAKNVGPLETGELCFRGPTIMKGYMGKNSNDIDKYGFYHTGDLGYYDDDGYFYIVGRIKEIMKYKGFQVAPTELENILLKHEAVSECAVIGIPDERAGQLPTACVVQKPESNVTEKELVDFVAERISSQKHLHGGVRFISKIPRNAAGKVMRDKLLEMCLK